jgi:hypothetical protein
MLVALSHLLQLVGILEYWPLCWLKKGDAEIVVESLMLWEAF